ncbi:MAG: RHS repeat-associated core domain-containing protein, partial [Anaerolineae bacterium]|nr:RHS repeat-associated core domain-containing protein [Anaerolineae bacterium]
GYYANNWLHTVTDPEDNVTSYTRDGVGLMTHTANPNNTISQATYDKANRMLMLVNRQVGGANQVISAFTYSYNEVGHRTQMVAEYSWRNPTVVTSDYGYDGLRRLIRDEDSEGVWNEYVYDRVGNRLELHTNDDAGSPQPFDEQHLTYSYSDSNRLLTIIGDTHPGQPGTKRQDNVGQTIYAFRHEVAAQAGKHITASAATNLLLLADDLIAALEGNPAPSVSEVAAAIEAMRQQVLSDRANGSIDSDGITNSLLAKLAHGDAANNGTSGDLQTQTFSYDANGNRINKEFPGPQGPQIQGMDYAYDPENRLVAAQDYQMNQQGNRVDRGMTTLEYDGGGRRLAKTYDPNEGGGGAKRVEYVFDGWDPVAEYNTWNPQYENFYRGALNRIITMHHFPIGTQGQMVWYHYDGLGSTSGLTKQNGNSHHNYRYEAYGEIEHAPGNHTDPHNHYTFTGQEWNENMGLYEFYARKYDPVTAVWLSQDTYRGQISYVNTIHRYSYVENNPITYRDFFGFAALLTETEKQTINELKSLEQKNQQLRTALNSLVVADYKSSMYPSFGWREAMKRATIRGYITGLSGVLNANEQRIKEKKNELRNMVVARAKKTSGAGGWCAAYVSDVYQTLYDAYYDTNWQRGNADGLSRFLHNQNQVIWENPGEVGKDLTTRKSNNEWLNLAQPGDILLIEPSDVSYNSSAAKTYGHIAIYLGDTDGDGVPNIGDSGYIYNGTQWYENVVISSVARPIR